MKDTKEFTLREWRSLMGKKRWKGISKKARSEAMKKVRAAGKKISTDELVVNVDKLARQE